MTASLAILLAALPGPAAACRLALLLALDVSASVDRTEYRLQAAGTAAALLAAPVRAAILAEPGSIAIAAFVWSGETDHDRIADWTLIDGPAALERLAARIAAHPRPAAFDGRTGIGAAMLAGAREFARVPDCLARTLDIATDGENNAGPAPETVRRGPALAGITINALSIGGDLPFDHETLDLAAGPLTAYLTRNVIHGPGAFVEQAEDYPDVERAMTRKLLRELQGMMIGALR
ncbi:MAG: DUF1194 domain-containing protein [Gemmobacter sp.]